MSKRAPTERVAAVTGVFVRLWSGIRGQGLAGWVASLLTALIVGGVAWARDHLPLSVVMLMGVGSLALVSFAYLRFREAQAIRGFDPKNLRELGRDLIDFSRRANATLADYETRNPQPDRLPNFDPHATWQMDRDREAARAGDFIRRHGAEAVGRLATLHKMGIDTPFHVTAGVSNRPDALVTYLGAIGHLLSEGQLAEAKSFGDDQGFRLTTMIR